MCVGIYIGRLCDDEDDHVASASPTGPMLSLVVTGKVRDRAPSTVLLVLRVLSSPLPLPSSHRFYETAHWSRRRAPPPAETVSRRHRFPNHDFPHPVDDRFIFRTHTHIYIYVAVQHYNIGPDAKRIRISSLCGRHEI